ncbi:MAG: hypothetical protein QOJ16_3509 [Acidobacteriota bacterium]|jgi:hypothetical protein|nr:hypothetical protein [Acidobacteriota bacterium]
MAAANPEKAAKRLLNCAFALLTFASVAPLIYLNDIVWASVFLALSIALTIVALASVIPLSLRFRIGAIATIYVLLTVAFASVHYFFYLADSTAYAFADGVAAIQLSRQRTSALRDIGASRAELAVLRELVKQPPQTLLVLKVKNRGVKLPSGATVKLVDDVFFAQPPVVIHEIELRTRQLSYTLKSERLLHPVESAVEDLFSPASESAFRARLLRLVTALESEEFRQTARLTSLRPEWSYVDFLYFSSVTMTTLGYGDIVPASRYSRALVGVQALSGVLLVAFAVTFLWPSQA